MTTILVKVLLIEDKRADVDVIEAALSETQLIRGELSHTQKLDQALSLLNNDHFDLILFDLSLADAAVAGGGIEAVRRLTHAAPAVPLVALTHNDDDGQALAVVKAGAQDYLSKPYLTGSLLGRTIRHAIERHRLLRDLEQQMTALLHSEVRFHTLIEHNADATVLVDGSSLIRFVNPAAETMFGRPAEELIGRPFDYPLEPDRAIEIEIVRPGQPETPIVAEMRVVETVWEQANPAYLASLRDITQRKQAERTLHRRTTELQARNEELDAFAHWVAHDLRNPLTLIVGYAKALEEEFTRMSPPEVAAILETVTQTGQRMSRIIDGLLILAGLRAQEIKVEPVDMAALVEEALNHLATLIGEYRPEISLPETWPVVLGFAPWITQVWMNYISNAIKYGGRPPRLTLGFSPTGDGFIRFWVRDNGAGFSTEQQAKLFTPFTRLQPVNPANGGLDSHGLGLSIVRRIIERLGGEVGAESSRQGSEFFFTLAAARSDSPSDQQPA
ncbi:MAG TPA: ATP-binding protein [Anaerolineae bacterium]|nr:ATP-binding protein [Anaerolineae bacterium]